MHKKLAIDALEAVEVDGTTQWIRVRSADAAHPVLLLIQQGPGLPMINEVRRFQHLLGLEPRFTVVYWDQAGCGRSLRNPRAGSDISLERMVGDTVSMLERLRDRFGSPTHVAGFSLGATLGAHASARRPDLVATLVAVGMDIDGAAAGTSAYDFALTSALQRGNQRAIRQLDAIGPPPHLVPKQFATRVRWATDLGGVTRNETYGSLARELAVSLVRSPDYSAADVVRTLRGISSTRDALLSELATLDLVRELPSLAVPVVMVQGRHDRVSPSGPAEQYFNELDAPSKQLVWFEDSAHTPQLDEPQKFRDLLIRALDRPSRDGPHGVARESR